MSGLRASTWDELMPLALVAVQAQPDKDMVDICHDLSKQTGHRITYDGLKHAMRARGLGSPRAPKHTARDTIPSPAAPGDGDVGTRRVFVFPDVHIPYHDKQALATAVEACHRLGVSDIVTIGDTMDFYGASRFSKRPDRKLKVVDEAAEVKEFLASLSDIRADKTYILGNHEARLDNYVADHAPALWGITDVNRLLGLEASGWRVIQYHETGWAIGKMHFKHDTGSASKHALQNSLEQYSGNLTIGHTHRGGVTYWGTGKGDKHVGMNVGWLGDIEQINYMHLDVARLRWQLGFGFVDIEANGDVFAHFVPIVNGRCRIFGETIKG